MTLLRIGYFYFLLFQPLWEGIDGDTILNTDVSQSCTAQCRQIGSTIQGPSDVSGQ